jgi:hypothetical protein
MASKFSKTGHNLFLQDIQRIGEPLVEIAAGDVNF